LSSGLEGGVGGAGGDAPGVVGLGLFYRVEGCLPLNVGGSWIGPFDLLVSKSQNAIYLFLNLKKQLVLIFQKNV
jgi:hypothetical protein